MSERLTVATRMPAPSSKHPLIRGTKVITLCGEVDQDSKDEDRETAPGSVGRITGVANERENGDPGFCYDLEFENGAWFTRDDFELDDVTRYRVV